MILSLLSFAAAVVCYVISQLTIQGKIKWNTSGGFFDEDGWMRKYKVTWTEDVNMDFMNRWQFEIHPAPKTWYYRFFKIKYKERFPMSATLLVFLTDAYHLMQFWFKIFMALAFVPLVGWWAVAYWVLFGVVFTICYKLFSR